MVKPPIHLVVPMSGQGTRFRQAGYEMPKPLVPVSGTPMIERLLSCFPSDWPTHFVLADNHAETGLPGLLRLLRPHASQHSIPEHKLGPGHAVKAALAHIPDDAPVFVSYCDYGMVWDPIQFRRFASDSACDACVVSYRGFHAHYLDPVTYAYSRRDGDRVVEVREKGCFTDDREGEFASAGGYYFRSASLLREALDFQFRERILLNGEAYTSLTVEALLRRCPDAHVRVFEIPFFFQWGTPEQLRTFEYWERCFQAYNRYAGKRFEVAQVLMPMAGRGSRFRALTCAQKPLIPVNGTPMFRAALNSLPRAERVVIVALAESRSEIEANVPSGTTVVALPETPAGQALSTEAGLTALRNDGDVIVSACDHAIVLDPEKWSHFRAAPRCDAAIFTVKGYPGALRRPEAYAYVLPAGADEPFPNVERVSVKRPLSRTPSGDALLVGTFWFADVAVLDRGIALLRERDVRVNGELYLDSVFELLLSVGFRVRMIPLDGIICWGDPEALAESTYWQECFGGYRFTWRPRFSSR